MAYSPLWHHRRRACIGADPRHDVLTDDPSLSKRPRFPTAIIRHSVGLDYRCSLRSRAGQAVMAERGRLAAQDDQVPDSLGHSCRNKQAAQKCCKKLPKGWRYVPRVRITDRLTRYAAMREGRPGVTHWRRPLRAGNVAPLSDRAGEHRHSHGGV